MSRRNQDGHGDHPEESLSLYADGELEGTERRRVEEHLEQCGRCQELVEELTDIAERAAQLPDRGPEEDLWPGIEAEIHAADSRTGADGSSEKGSEQDDTSSDRSVIPLLRRDWRVSATQIAAAAGLVAALASGITWSLTRDGTTTPARVAAIDTPGSETPDRASNGAMRLASVEGVPASLDTLERRYREARDELDAETRRRLDEQLRLIDRVLEEARQELREHPDNGYLQQHLTRLVRRKAEFLAMAVQMTSET